MNDNKCLVCKNYDEVSENAAEIFKERLAPYTSVKIATLKNDAGIIGAAALKE